MGSFHPRHKDLHYPVNYGYVSGLLGGDGAEQDIYLLGGKIKRKRREKDA